MVDKLWTLMCDREHWHQGVELLHVYPELAPELIRRLRWDSRSRMDSVVPSTQVACALAEFAPVWVPGGKVRSHQLGPEDRLDRLRGLKRLDVRWCERGASIDGCLDLLELRGDGDTRGMAPNLQRFEGDVMVEEVGRWSHLPELVLDFEDALDVDELWDQLDGPYRCLHVHARFGGVVGELPEVTDEFVLDRFEIRAEQLPAARQIRLSGVVTGRRLVVPDGCRSIELDARLPREVHLPPSVEEAVVRGPGLRRVVVRGGRPARLVTDVPVVLD